MQSTEKSAFSVIRDILQKEAVKSKIVITNQELDNLANELHNEQEILKKVNGSLSSEGNQLKALQQKLNKAVQQKQVLQQKLKDKQEEMLESSSKKFSLFLSNVKKMIIAFLQEDLDKKNKKTNKYIFQSIPLAITFQGKKYRFEASGIMMSVAYLKEQLRRQIPGIKQNQAIFLFDDQKRRLLNNQSYLFELWGPQNGSSAGIFEEFKISMQVSQTY